MRGFFGRNRMEKPQPGVVIHSYEEALYPPRPYRYHVQQQQPPPPQTQSRQQGQQQVAPTIVLPSVDADSVCEPHTRIVPAGGAFAGPAAAAAQVVGAQVVEKKPPPVLREYFACFAPVPFSAHVSATSAPVSAPQPMARKGSHRGTGVTTEADSPSNNVALEQFSCLARYAQFEGRAAGWIEPLNVFHYPQLLVPQEQDERHVRHAVAGLADALGIPQELRTFLPPVSDAATGAMKMSARTESKLRIRAAPRQRPARVLRRGAKVAILAPAHPAPGFTGHHHHHHGHHSTAAAESTGASAAHGKRPRALGSGVNVLDLLNEDDDEHTASHHVKRARGEEDGADDKAHGAKPSSGHAAATGDGWDEGDADAEDAEDDDELSVDLYDAADDDDQADVDDVGGDDDGGEYY